MADDISYGGFTNPGFVTPEQVLQQRQIVNQLMSGAIAPDASKHWTGVLAQALMGAQAGLGQNQANQMQRQILQQGANAIQGAGQNNLYTGIITGQNPTSPQASNAAPSGDGNALKAAILMQESGNNPNIRSSYAGAVGPGQVMPQTFASIAKPGENINDATDNRNVSGRLLDKYMQDYGDPARAAVAYFSGPGNVAPPGSPTPWIKDKSDGTKTTSSYVSDVMRRIGGGQQTTQNGGLANFYMTPGIPQELKDNVLKGNTPIPVQDVRGRTGVQEGVMGATHLTPIARGFEQGYRGNVAVGPDGGVTAPMAFPADAMNAKPIAEQMQPMFDLARQAGQRGAANKAVQGGIESDVQSAQAAFPIMQNLDMMANDIEKHGDNMNFGPSAEFMTNLKGIVANHLPSFMSQAEIEGLAAQNTMRKQTALLATAIGRQTGNTDLSLLQGNASVPGEHNSKEGNKAIIDMLKQQVGLNSRFVMENYRNYGQPGFDPLAAKAKFYKENPIINPLTKHPITVDLVQGEKVSQSQKDFKKLSDDEIKKRLGIP